MTYLLFSIGLSAFLLFIVEPLIGKTLLPWFGGVPAVWSTAMLFFQVLLTGGYAYAAWMSRSVRRRGRLHLILLGLSVLVLLVLGIFWRSPLTPAAALKPNAALAPVLDIFLLLSITVGLPFFLLASNSTLVQAWFARAFPRQSPYRLYALSNLSSLVALLAYPSVVEPNLSIPWQGWLWSAGYLAFAGLAGYATIKAMRSLPPEPTVQPAAQSPAPPARDYLAWLLLSACASVLYLAVTGYLTIQVAVIPFLWVLPLGIYLLSFVLAFSSERAYPRQVFIILLLPLVLLYNWAMAKGPLLPVPLQLGIFSLVLFTACMICNGELYRRRPAPARLPAFYLTVSAGGMAGGLVITFLAPAVFKGFWELPLGMLFFCLLFLFASRGAQPNRVEPGLLPRLNTMLLIAAVIIAGLRAFMFIGSDLNGSIHIWRDFYGVVRLRQVGSPGDPDYSYQLINGNTIHGAQFPGSGRVDAPTVYFGPHSGVGLALLNHPRSASGLRVGVLGLGIGTIAAYGQPGDSYTFYEINPQVIQLAQGRGGYFTYLKDTRAKVQIVQGDARLSLENELSRGQAQKFDVLVLDVFSSDSIPVHLLDEQAFALYQQFLQPDGVLAVHITNGYLDLLPVVWRLADAFALHRVVIDDPGDGHDTLPSLWVLLAKEPAMLSVPAIAGRARPLAGYTSSMRLWTDEYSNLFQILKH
ncbi:MAG TPA: hypothetical protein VMT91_10130 [Anaerolineales bacterium]|nr:hypothetical protein [Anaerolineales bacterium]